ncbi:hypothetical protein BDV97DRAFT_344633 [Delphinella strobiligena]|nr:hypothetical protein BDV97DRAFT_344633 [Delphinella strobiligena]
MSGWARPRNLLIGGGVLAALAFVPTPGSKSTNPFETQGTKNITNRFSASGGTDVHTPGVATKRGDAADTRERQNANTGMPSEHFKEYQSDQRPGKPGPFDKAWNEAHYGHEKGK